MRYTQNNTKQQNDPYIWDYNIKVKTKDGYDYEEETKAKVKKIDSKRNV